MLGGGSAPFAQEQITDEVVFVGDARDNPSSVEFLLALRTRRLLPFQYPEAQLPLSDRVLALRDSEGLTFRAIADKLTAEGWVGARGARLGAEGTYSVYKKRKAHDESRSSPVRYRIGQIVVLPRDE